MRQGDNSTFYLDGWTDFQSRVDWLVRIDKPGIFDIYAEVAAEEPVAEAEDAAPAPEPEPEKPAETAAAEEGATE